jgi:hypothetical protein
MVHAHTQGAAAAAEVVRLKDEVTALRKVAEEAQARERDALKQVGVMVTSPTSSNQSVISASSSIISFLMV